MYLSDPAGSGGFDGGLFLIVDRSGRIVQTGPGLMRSEGVAASASPSLDQVFKGQTKELLATLSDATRASKSLFFLELDGEEYTCHAVCLTPVSSSAPATYLLALTPRTGSLQFRQELEQRNFHRYMDRLRTIATGLSRELGNLFTIIQGSAELLQTEATDSPMAGKQTRQLIEAGGRGRQLVRYLLRAAADTPPNRKNIELSQLVQTVIQEFAQSHPPPGRYRVEESSPTGALSADPEQVREALEQLLLNAAQAGEGPVTVRLGRIRLQPRDIVHFLHSAPLSGGDYVFLEVADKGKGMSDEVERRSTDAFYTTRMGALGLGLPVAQGIAYAHGGGLQLESHPGEGTTVRLIFPGGGTGQGEEKPDPIQRVRASRGRYQGKVLVVDDEEPVRKVAMAMLERLGFTVIQAEDGDEAVELYDKHRSEIRLVLLDLLMPRMGGAEVFRQLKDKAPELPVIISTGYDLPGVRDRFSQYPATLFLNKPYRLDALLDSLNTLFPENP